MVICSSNNYFMKIWLCSVGHDKKGLVLSQQSLFILFHTSSLNTAGFERYSKCCELCFLFFALTNINHYIVFINNPFTFSDMCDELTLQPGTPGVFWSTFRSTREQKQTDGAPSGDGGEGVPVRWLQGIKPHVVQVQVWSVPTCCSVDGLLPVCHKFWSAWAGTETHQDADAEMTTHSLIKADDESLCHHPAWCVCCS